MPHQKKQNCSWRDVNFAWVPTITAKRIVHKCNVLPFVSKSNICCWAQITLVMWRRLLHSLEKTKKDQKYLSVDLQMTAGKREESFFPMNMETQWFYIYSKLFLLWAKPTAAVLSSIPELLLWVQCKTKPSRGPQIWGSISGQRLALWEQNSFMV